MISRKIATGVVALASVVTLGAAAVPSSAAPVADDVPSSAAPVADDAIVIENPQETPATEEGAEEVEIEVTTASCGEWNRAVGIPGRWSSEIKDGCAHFGRPGLKVGYSWKAERGRPCIKVKGFVNGRAKWYDAGCGARGEVRNVPWGNVAAEKGIKVKGASLFEWR